MTERLDKDEAAARVGVSPVTLARMRSRGEGPPYIRMAQKIWYRADQVDAWVNEQFDRAQLERREAEEGFHDAVAQQLRRRRAAADRCTPLEDGRRDPLDPS